ncbi:MAG: RHS repeat protein [Candidatus Obscuribacterales bacterium]|nr:RHS repeat protein [Candidatus Obscuribacterales bacterium]
MAKKSLDLGTFAYQGSPFIWGSMQDLSGLTVVYQAAPQFGVQDMPGTNYVMDTRGRLTNINLTNGQSQTHNLDDAGNRTSIVTA